MESLAHAAVMVTLFSSLLGGAAGTGIGWFVSKEFNISKIRCMIIGGTIGLPIGFFALSVLSRIFS